MRLRHRQRAQRAQTLAEFAFVIVAFMLLTMAVVDFGRGILFYNMLANSVREGARYGVVSSTSEPDICNVVRAAMQAPGVSTGSGCGSFSNLDVEVTQGASVTDDSGISCEKESGTEVIVVSHYNFSPITPLIGDITGNPITLTAKSTMYNENWRPTGGCE